MLIQVLILLMIDTCSVYTFGLSPVLNEQGQVIDFKEVDYISESEMKKTYDECIDDSFFKDCGIFYENHIPYIMAELPTSQAEWMNTQPYCGRVLTTALELPSLLIMSLDDKILRSFKGHSFRHVIPYNASTSLWQANLRNENGQNIRLGAFDDEYVAAIVVTAARHDARLLSKSLIAKCWLDVMIRDPKELQIWISRYAINV